jgi:hypothetical protein
VLVNIFFHIFIGDKLYPYNEYLIEKLQNKAMSLGTKINNETPVYLNIINIINLLNNPVNRTIEIFNKLIDDVENKNILLKDKLKLAIKLENKENNQLNKIIDYNEYYSKYKLTEKENIDHFNHFDFKIKNIDKNITKSIEYIKIFETKKIEETTPELNSTLVDLLHTKISDPIHINNTYDESVITMIVEQVINFINTLKKCDTEFKKIRNKHVAISEMLKNKINLLDNVKCQKTIAENIETVVDNALGTEPKIPRGKIIDVNYHRRMDTIPGNQVKNIRNKLTNSKTYYITVDIQKVNDYVDLNNGSKCVNNNLQK